MNYYLAKQYLKYKLFSKHKGGHGIHSPFVFNLLTEIIEDKNHYYCFSEIENIRKILLQDNRKIKVIDFGAGSNVLKSETRKISDIARYSLSQQKYSQLLFRLVNYFKPNRILELGTSLGISTLYLSFPDSKIKVHTIEASNDIADIANSNFMKLNRKNIKLINSTFQDALDKTLEELKCVDFAFIDGNHKKESTIDYFEKILEYSNPNTVMVFDDIYWSAEMTEAWKYIKSSGSVSISIDLFQFGIVVLNKDFIKQDFRIRF